jgi:hypothetical protein
MKVSELIKALSKCRNQDAEVYLWVDGDRMKPSMVDDFVEDASYVDINAEEGESK